tara:strand:- start:2893 stop:3363 length:471 start_codon:yes stop_codon:yes gene_type:complete
MEWQEFTGMVTTYANDKKSEIDSEDKTSVLRLIERGNANEKKQARCTTAIRLIIGDYSDSPTNSRGFSLPDDAQAVVQSAYDAIAGLASVYNENPVIAALLLPHGRSTATHLDGETWANRMVSHMEDTARSLYESKTWDGSEKSLVATVSFTTEDN